MEGESTNNKRSCLNLADGEDDAHDSPTLGRHLSKSASELSNTRGPHGETERSTSEKQHRARSTVSPSSVVQKTHGFFHTLRHRWSRGRSRERRRSPGRPGVSEDGLGNGAVGGGGGDSQSTDYAADYSSEHSSSATPHTQSPRHRACTLGDSPLARQGEPLAPDSPRLKGMLAGDSYITAVLPIDLLQPVDEAQRRREASLRQHSFFQLRVHLRKGQNLAAMDKNGTSDPYVKFKLGGRLLHKSKTLHRDLNPIWDESFTVPIEDPFQPIQIKVFDYDWGLQDDFMGSAQLELTSLELGRQQEVILPLVDPARPGRDLGELLLTATLLPRSQEDKEQYFQRYPRLSDANRRLKSQIWSSVVTIVLVEAKGLPTLDIEGGTSDPYVRFRLANEKYKSKASWRMRWVEQCDLHLFDDQEQLLELSVWCKARGREEHLGRAVIDLSNMERENTHGMWTELEEGGSVFLLLTISGTTSSETISDLTAWREDPRERTVMDNRYLWHRSLQNLRDVGHLTVKVFGASGLASADLGGKSDPFCVLELVNARLQTQTEYKTLAPSWQKIFTFNVKDMTSVLEVTVYDEDRDHKVEFLGRISVPLLRIRNGERRWYALKDKKLRSRAKGQSPQILLEMTVLWSPIRAALRALTPKEEKLMRPEMKFKRQVFVKNVLRLKVVIMWLLEVGRIVQSCFEWESRTRSFAALVLWLMLCHWFDACMVPLVLLLLLLRNWLVLWLTGGAAATVHHGAAAVPGAPGAADEGEEPISEDDDEDDKDKEEKKSLKERLQAIQEVTQTVQNSIGYLATLGESVKNMFNFAVPELSWLAALLLVGAALVLWAIPVRVLLMFWGVNKFARRILRPHVAPNNELLDLLSRVPDDEDLYVKHIMASHGQYSLQGAEVASDARGGPPPRRTQEAQAVLVGPRPGATARRLELCTSSRRLD